MSEIIDKTQHLMQVQNLLFDVRFTIPLLQVDREPTHGFQMINWSQLH